MTPVRTFRSSPLPPYERGVEFGQQLAGEVRRTVEAYRQLFVARARGPFDVDAWSERAWQAIQEYDAPAADEIRGIADGAGLSVAEVAAVNARTELLAAADPTGVQECSTVVSLPEDGPPVAAQTWDWYDVMAEGWLHWTIPFPDGRVVETVTEYGVLAKIGASTAGVGVMLNMLHHERDDGASADGIGYPVHLLSRRILTTCDDVDGAVALARAVSVTASTSLTVVDGSHAASVELFPGGPGVVEPEDGLLVRTNHFVSAAGESGCLADTIGPSSRIRRDTLLGAFKPQRPREAWQVLDAMEDHDDTGGVCVHPDRRTEPAMWHATLATVVVDVTDGSLGVVPGGPCAR